MLETVVGGKVTSLILTGTCLAIGFWMGKKITNKIDYLWYTQTEEFKNFVKARQTPEVVEAVTGGK